MDFVEKLVSLFSFSLVAGYAVAVAAGACLGLWIWRRRNRLPLLRARHEARQAALRSEGRRKRQTMAHRCQRANILELAAIVSRQLEAVRQALHPCLYQRATVVVERTVEELDFERLYTLHGLLSGPGGRQMVPALETLLQGERSA